MGLLAQGTNESLSFGEAYVWLIVGIILSVVVPVAASTLRPPTSGALQAMTWQLRFGALISRFGKIGIASAVIALLFAIVFDFDTTRLAFLAGYAWDSTLQKVVPR